MAMIQIPGRRSVPGTSPVSGPTGTPGGMWAVNLLPAETAQRQAESNLIRRFMVAGVGVVALTGVAWVAQTVVIKVAENDLAVAGVAQQAAQQALARLEPIQTFASAMSQQNEVIGTTMATHTSFADALRGFRSAWPAGSEVQTLDAKLGAGCPGPEPFQPPASIGCITWSVSVPGQKQVRDLVADLSGVPGFVSPYLINAARNESAFDSSGTVNFDDRLLTHRFSDKLSEVTP
jgi:hypothetical protein